MNYITIKKIQNYINGQWVSRGHDFLEIINPATGDQLALVPSGSREDVMHAAEKANSAWPAWRNTPVTQRIQYLFQMKRILESHGEEIATVCTQECGKTIADPKPKSSAGRILNGLRCSRTHTG
jgi:malonate-semialdehyde dehydrogenase (acetylating)/methylmalonate-semialdehyde dehydrogenase